MQDEYFSLNKAEREAVATNSELAKNLVAISNYPSELLWLKLVGVGKILTGIFLLLLGILLARRYGSVKSSKRTRKNSPERRGISIVENHCCHIS